MKHFQREYVARSEARRLPAGREKFKELELDFRDVKAIGQGFADEVFRVFARAHPGSEIEPVNANRAVQAMLRHLRASLTGAG